MPFGLGMWETLAILVALLLLFGAKRLPEIGTSLGKGIREFKSSVREIENTVHTETKPRSGGESVPPLQSGDEGSAEESQRLKSG